MNFVEILADNWPHLFLVACQPIYPGEEILGKFFFHRPPETAFDGFWDLFFFSLTCSLTFSCTVSYGEGFWKAFNQNRLCSEYYVAGMRVAQEEAQVREASLQDELTRAEAENGRLQRLLENARNGKSGGPPM